MTWSLRLGSNAEWLAKVAREQGKQFASLMDAPTLEPHEAFYFAAFQDLTGSRMPTGMGVSPIMLTEILAYAELRCIENPNDRMLLAGHVRAMDAAYLKHLAGTEVNG